MTRILAEKNMAFCNIQIERNNIEETGNFAYEVAKTLKEYADMILHGNASNLPIEKFINGDITITVVAGFSNPDY